MKTNFLKIFLVLGLLRSIYCIFLQGDICNIIWGSYYTLCHVGIQTFFRVSHCSECLFPRLIIVMHWANYTIYSFLYIDVSQQQLQSGKDTSCNCGRKATSRSQRFCVQAIDEKKTRCPCVLHKSKCKCLDCGNREEEKEELSCRCGESSRKKSQVEGVERKYCTNVDDERQTKCRCYKKGQPCSNLCACYFMRKWIWTERKWLWVWTFAQKEKDDIQSTVFKADTHDNVFKKERIRSASRTVDAGRNLLAWHNWVAYSYPSKTLPLNSILS